MRYLARDRVLGNVFLLVVILFAITSCSSAEEAKKETGIPYYYKSVEIKRHFPPKPMIQFASKEEAQKNRVYYTVYFDQKGRIILCAKMVENKICFLSRYYYSEVGYAEKEDYSSYTEGHHIDYHAIYYYDKDGMQIRKEILKPGTAPYKNGEENERVKSTLDSCK